MTEPLKYSSYSDYSVVKSTKGPFSDTEETVFLRNWTQIYGFPRSRVYPKPIRSDTPGYIRRISQNTEQYEWETYRSGQKFSFAGPASFIGTQMFLSSGGDPSKFTFTSTEKDARSAALKAYAKLGQGRFNAAVFIGELKPTIHMVAKRSNQLRTAMKNLQEGNWKGFGEVLPKAEPPSRRQRAKARDSWGDVWLEYTYGWSPLVSDVYGAMSALQKGVSGSGTPVSARSGRGGIGRGRERGTSDSAANLAKPMAQSAVFSGTVSNPGARTLQELGLANPAALAWELLPYSFVADWFLPIGDILAALTAGTGLMGVTGSIVYETRNKQDRIRSGFWIQTEQFVYRQPISPFWAIWGALFAQDGLSESWRRMTSAIALLNQQASRPAASNRRRR